MVGISSGDRGRTGQHHAQSIGKGRHGGRRAHGHADAVRAGNADFHLAPVFCRNIACAPLIPIFEGVGARPQHFAMPVAAQHGAGGYKNRRHARTCCAQQQSRCGLVASSHQNNAINGMGADQLFRFHREKVAIEHGRWFHLALGQRDGGQFHRKATRLQNTAPDIIDALFEMGMALVEIGPGIDDGNHRLACIFFQGIAHLIHARAMAEGSKIIRAEPARGA